jgi:RNA polymerase sigma-70 factor (ECF subfamily)
VELDEIYSDSLSDEIDPEWQMQEDELRIRIELAINALPKKCRLIFFMVKEEGMIYKDVARILSISVRTVQAQICIALKRLHAVIKEYQLSKQITTNK